MKTRTNMGAKPRRRGSGRVRVSLLPRLARWAGVGVFVLGAGILSCDGNGTGPEPYDGPWEVVDCPDLPDLHYLTGVHFVDTDLGYCVGGPYILKWDGFSWKKDYELIPVPPYNLASCYDVYFLNENSGWVAGGEGTANEGEVVILHWDGRSWKRVPQDLPMKYLYCIFFLDENNGWVAGDGIAKWEGHDWTFETGIYAVSGIYIKDVDDGWAISYGGPRIYHYDGVTWEKVFEQSMHRGFGMGFHNENRGWAAGGRTLLLEYVNGKWQEYARTENLAYCEAVHFAPDGAGWAVGQRTYKWNETQNKWLYVEAPFPRGTLRDVFVLNEGDAWAVGDARTILHYQPKDRR